MRAGITPRMCPLPIPRMSKNEATESQRQSEAIRGNQLLVIQRPSETIRFNQATPQVQSDAIGRQSDTNQTQSGAISIGNQVIFRGIQTQSACPEHCVFRVFVFWAGTSGLCFVCSCFGSPPSKHSGGQINVL